MIGHLTLQKLAGLEGDLNFFTKDVREKIQRVKGGLTLDEMKRSIRVSYPHSMSRFLGDRRTRCYPSDQTIFSRLAYQRITFKAMIARSTQETRNAVPPMGVIAPNHVMPVIARI